MLICYRKKKEMENMIFLVNPISRFSNNVGTGVSCETGYAGCSCHTITGCYDGAPSCPPDYGY